MNLIKILVLPLFTLFSVAQAQAPIINAPEPVTPTLEQQIEQLSLKYNVATSTATNIIWCESRNNAHATGTLAVVGRDIGYWQINTYFHEEAATKMGLNIYKPEDNLEYGFWLFSKQGVSPWNASAGCWKP